MAARRGVSVWWRWMPVVVCAIVTALVATLIAYSRGYSQERVPLNNAGVWVTSNDYQASARFNTVSVSADMVLSPPGAVANDVSLDVFQDGDSVVSRVVGAGILVPVDPISGVNLDKKKAAVRPNAAVAAGGGSTGWVTLATVDKSDGTVRAVRSVVDTIPDIMGLDQSMEPLATLPKAALVAEDDGMDVAVGRDGSVYAASASGDVITIPAKGAGFGQPVTSALNRSFSSVRVSVVGSRVVVVDPVGCTVVVQGGNAQTLDKECQAAVQWPGPEAQSVMVATSTGLYRMPMDSGEPVVMIRPQHSVGVPARPIVADGWVLSAWAGDPGVLGRVRTGGGDPSSWDLDLNDPKHGNALLSPVFRENRGHVLLNDMATGLTYDPDLRQSVIDWDEIKPDVEKPEDTTNCADGDAAGLPVANDDEQGVRPGRTTAVYVLDNDTGACKETLAVTAVTQPSQGSVMIAPDAQSVLITMPEGAGNVSFEYTVRNIAGREDQATVSIQVRAPSENGSPKLALYTAEDDYTIPTYPVVSGGMVALSVTGVWRDPDGDPVIVQSASAGGKTLPVTGQGLIHYAAGRVESDEVVEVSYVVTDGRPGSAQPGQARVKVQAFNATQGIAPEAKTDVVRARVGVPMSFFPLANDIPGSDPLRPNARLALGGSVASQIDVSVSTNQVSGEVTVTAQQAGSYRLAYTAAFGAATFASGTIRVVATDDGDDSPVAMPDQVTVRGRVPVTVDPLANDWDPRGNVLTIVAVESPNPELLTVAVVAGRWLRIEAKTVTMGSEQVVTYRVTNGLGEAVTGDVTVSQLDAVDPDRAIVNNDYATVRAGDQVSIPVLDNDASESGAPLVVTDNVAGLAPGELAVMDGDGVTDPDRVGRAVVRRDQVVYMPPLSVDEPKTVTIRYSASVAGQSGDDGVVTVTVNPAIEEGNRPPVPIGVEARGVAGETLTIPIQIYGIDPDGDSVQVVGLASPAKYGRVSGVSPTSITYEVFPSREPTGSDSFDFVVADRWGATGVATVRVGLAPPGQTQPPVAVEDTVTASPGASVEVHPMANDLIPVGDSAQLVPLESLGNVPDGVSAHEDAAGKLAIIEAKAPASADDPALTFPYALTGSGGQGPTAAVTIRSVEGYNNPPRVYDHVAKVSADGLSASVDVLDNAWDVDGPATDLTVSAAATGATFANSVVNSVNVGLVSVPVTERPQAVWFMVADKLGGVSAAVVFVPGTHSNEIYLYNQDSITMAANSSVTVELNDYIMSPRGEQVHFDASAKAWASPSAWLEAAPVTTSTVTLTAKNDQSGPAALSVWVTDAASPDDSEALSALMTIAVQVGDPAPVMWCPTDTQYVTQGGDVLNLDITSLCHVWVPESESSKLPDMLYTASLSLPGVSVQGGHVVSIDPSGSATPGQSAVLSLGVDGYPSLTGELTIEVQAAPKPTITIPNIADVPPSTTVTATLSMHSPLKDPSPTIVSVTRISGPQVSAGFQGTGITVVSGEDRGVVTLRVVASDVADSGRTDRQVSGEFTVTVYGRPDPPTPPQPGTALRSHVASVTFSPNADNGSPIDEYEVQWPSGSQSCGLNTHCEITGLANGVAVRFQVRAHNKAGWSDWSATGGEVTPNAVPGAVTRFRAEATAQSNQLVLSWDAAPVDGTPVTQYTITWSGGPTIVGGNTTTVTISTPSNNTAYTFTIVAENKAGLSAQNATATGQSSGKPTMVSVEAKAGSIKGPSGNAQVTVNWMLRMAEGPSETITFDVTRTGGTLPSKTWTQKGTTLSDSVPFDGGQYTYSVTATVAPGGPSHTSDPVTSTWTAVGIPDPWAPGSLTAEGTGVDGQLKITAIYPASNGAVSSLSYYIADDKQAKRSGSIDYLDVHGGTTTWLFQWNVQPASENGRLHTIEVYICNRYDCSTTTTTATPFGPLRAPTLKSSSLTATQACATLSANGNGGEATATVTATWSGSTPKSQAFTGVNGFSGDHCVTVPPRTTVTFTATLADTAHNRGPLSATHLEVTTWAEPPTIGVIKVWQDGRNACASVTGDGKGHQSSLTLAWGGTGKAVNGDSQTKTGTGSMTTPDLCVTVPDTGGTVMFFATISTNDTSVDPAQTEISAPDNEQYIPPAYSPTVSISQGPANPNGSGGYNVRFKIDGFPSGNVSCSFAWHGPFHDILSVKANWTMDGLRVADMTYGGDGLYQKVSPVVEYEELQRPSDGTVVARVVDINGPYLSGGTVDYFKCSGGGFEAKWGSTTLGW